MWVSKSVTSHFLVSKRLWLHVREDQQTPLRKISTLAQVSVVQTTVKEREDP